MRASPLFATLVSPSPERAHELAHGIERPANQEAGDLVLSMTLEQYFATLARTIDGPAAGREQSDPIVLQWLVNSAEEEACTTTLRNGVLVYVPGKDHFAGTPQTVIKLTREVLNGLMYGPKGFKDAFDAAVRDGLVQIPEGKQDYADTVFGYLTASDPSFPIVAPTGEGATATQG
ncbi:alkyl sulfatase C-terminal domain-containing protein [Streptomyces sp. NPDC001262]|uniref:alkyl sulfatase C-terminal domain-containing protein n=1 Tax=Streptomyces sp. NPDC001262 TaxID=3364552 RepID=UPI0036C7FDB3